MFLSEVESITGIDRVPPGAGMEEGGCIVRETGGIVWADKADKSTKNNIDTSKNEKLALMNIRNY